MLFLTVAQKRLRFDANIVFAAEAEFIAMTNAHRYQNDAFQHTFEDSKVNPIYFF